MTTVTKTPQRYALRVLGYSVIREAEPEGERLLLDSPDKVAAAARTVIPDDDREHFGVFILDSKNRAKGPDRGYHEVSVGSMSATIVHAREVFRAAIVGGAAHLIVVHNHPSGDVTPSNEDIALTRQLVEGGRLLGIRVHDHVIIAHGSEAFCSLAQKGLA